MRKSIQSPVRAVEIQEEGLRITPDVWEDGARTSLGAGFFERWNFEATLNDGSHAAIVFFTRPLLEDSSSPNPGVSLTFTRPDGKKLNQVSLVETADFSSSKERCYVRAGASWVRYEDGSYELHAKIGDLSAHLKFTGILPAWRPGAGKYAFGTEKSRYIAWLAPIPYGTVEGQVIFDGKLRNVQGTCYHDHRWGSTGLNDILAQWYWGRAQAGGYTVLFAEMTATEKYGRKVLPLFYLARSNEVLVEDCSQIDVDVLDYQPDPGGRSYPNGMNLTWQADTRRARLALRDVQLLDSFSLVDFLPTLRRLIGGIVANPYSFRLQTSADLTIALPDIETREQGRAVCELMLFR